MRQHFLRSNYRDQGEPEEFIPDSESEDYDDIGERGMQSENMCGPSGAEAGTDEDPSSDFFYDDDEDTDPDESDTGSHNSEDSENETHEDDYDSSSNYNGHQDDDSDSAVNDAGEYAFEADDKDGSPGDGSRPKTPPGTMDPNNYGVTASNTSILSEGTPQANADFMNEVHSRIRVVKSLGWLNEGNNSVWYRTQERASAKRTRWRVVLVKKGLA